MDTGRCDDCETDLATADREPGWEGLCGPCARSREQHMTTPAGWHSPTEPPLMPKTPLLRHHLRRRRRYLAVSFRGRLLTLWGKP